jgi:hypothetical protein
VLALGALPDLRERLHAVECENDELRQALREIRNTPRSRGIGPARTGSRTVKGAVPLARRGVTLEM